MTADGLPLAMTMGDPAGIGPELALAAWRGRAASDPPFFLLASPAHLAAVARRIGLDAPIIETTPERAAGVAEAGETVIRLELLIASNRPGLG